MIGVADENIAYKTTTIGEPQLGRHNLYPTLQKKEMASSVEEILNILSFCDGNNSAVRVANKTKTSIYQCINSLKKLKAARVIE